MAVINLNAQIDGIDRDSLREMRGIEIRDGLAEELGITGESILSNPWPCYEYRFNSGRAYDVEISGSYAFVANWTSLQVLDVSDPTNPTYFTSINTPNYCTDLAVYGNYILATITGAGLYIYYFNPDSSQKLSLVATFWHNTSVEYRNVDVSGCYAYVSCRYGLEVINISDIANPQHGIYVSKGSLNKDLVASGPWVFMAGAFQGVHIFDLRQWFANGGAVTTYTIAYVPRSTRNSYDVDVDGNLVYVADYYNGLEVFDWQRYIAGQSDWWVGECSALQTVYPVGVAVDGNWAFLTTTKYGDSLGALYLIEVDTLYRGMPFYDVSINKDGGFEPFDYSDWIAMVSMQYYSATHPSSVFRFECPFIIPPKPPYSQPLWISHAPYPYTGRGNWISKIVRTRDTLIAYIADEQHILSKVMYRVRYSWLSSGPIPGGRMSENGTGWSVALEDAPSPQLAYIATNSGIVVTKTSTLTWVDIMDTLIIRGEIETKGMIAYVAGICTNRWNRFLVARYDLISATLDTFFERPPYDTVLADNRYFGLLDFETGNTAFATATARSKEWMGGTDPIPLPTSNLIFHLDTMGTGYYYHHPDNAPTGQWASLNYYGHSWVLYDLRGMEADAVAPDSQFAVFYHGERDGVHFPWYYYDYSYPNYFRNYVRNHFMDRTGYNLFIAVWNDNYPYGNRYPLWHASVVLPGAAPQFHKITCDSVSFSKLIFIHFTIWGDYLFLLSKQTGFDNYYIDVVRYRWPVIHSGKASHDNLLKPEKWELTVFPNPFNGELKIKFNMQIQKNFPLEIYNLSGQKVRTLLKSDNETETHILTWDGKNDEGIDLPSGLYFCRLKSVNNTTKKVILIR